MDEKGESSEKWRKERGGSINILGMMGKGEKVLEVQKRVVKEKNSLMELAGRYSWCRR